MITNEENKVVKAAEIIAEWCQEQSWCGNCPFADPDGRIINCKLACDNEYPEDWDV